MVKLTHFLVLASGLAVTAFSLERTSFSRINGNSKLATGHSTLRRELLTQPSSTRLYAEDAEPGSASPASSAAEVVAAETEKKGGLMSMIWNEGTKLTIYLAVWYLGNIYCKLFLDYLARFQFR